MVGVSEFNKNGVLLGPLCSGDSCFPYSFLFSAGFYKFEAWGGSGGGILPGLGGYVSGFLALPKRQILHLFIGQKGINGQNSAWNGGGFGQEGGSSGGGSSDVRLTNGSWYDFESLKSRILVSGGGGGSQNSMDYSSAGGNSGGIEGSSGNYKSIGSLLVEISSGGGQNWGGHGGVGMWSGASGGFGYGGNGSLDNNNGNGGGGGYFGGGGGATSTKIVGSGAGGSSFISGYHGCLSIVQSSNPNNMVFSVNSLHYSGLYFADSAMISGGNVMPHPISGENVVGWDGDGYIRITIISTISEPTKYCQCFRFLKYAIIILLSNIFFFTM